MRHRPSSLSIILILVLSNYRFVSTSKTAAAEEDQRNGGGTSNSPTSRMDYLAVRFHVRGRMEYVGKEWNYIGGRTGHSTVAVSNLSIQVLKMHLLEFLVISDEDLEDTTLSWRLIEKEQNLSCMCRLEDNTNVKNMVRHMTRVADGFVEIFAVSPERHAIASSDEEQEAMVIEQKEEQQVQHEQQVVTEQQV